MTSANIINSEFLTFYEDCGNLHDALEPIVVPQPARRGVRRQAPVAQATPDIPALEVALQESLYRLLNNPLTKAEPKGHGIMPLKAIHDCRKFYAVIATIARSGDETASAKVADDEIPHELDGLLGKFVVAIDPTHPFLPVEVEEEKKVDGEAEVENPDEEQ